MLTGRRYLLALTDEQINQAERFGAICRAVWNTGLEQRREYRRRGAWITYVEQARQMAEAKKDLEKACRTHGTWKVRWRSKAKTPPAFRFPDPKHIQVERLNRRWGRARLPKLGWVRLRWTRPPGGAIRNATVARDGGRWYISFCVDDGVDEAMPNGRSAVGVDRGVTVAVANSDAIMHDREFVTAGEQRRIRRSQQRLARSRRVHGRDRRSKRRDAVRAELGRLNARIRARHTDFAARTAHELVTRHGLVAVENLRVGNMTRSAKGTAEAPGVNVRQKAGLNRSILNKGWGGLLLALEHAARYHGAVIVKVNPAYTFQRCSRCDLVDANSRKSQAEFTCTGCGHRDNADVTAAKNILAAGLAVTGRGGPAAGRPVKRQPPERRAA